MKIKFLIICTIGFSASAFCQKEYKAVPDFVVMQVAGSIGTISTGVGYNVFNSRARVSTHFGLVPIKSFGVVKVVSAKFFYRPLSLLIWNRVRLNPVDFGFIGSYSFGNTAKNRSGEAFDINDNYWFNPALKAHLGMETSVTFEFPKVCPLHSVTSYMEFNTNDLYFIHVLKSPDSFRIQNVVRVGMGTRLTF